MSGPKLMLNFEDEHNAKTTPEPILNMSKSLITNSIPVPPAVYPPLNGHTQQYSTNSPVAESTDVQNVLHERGKRYGTYAGQAKISQTLQDVVRNSSSWELMTDVEKDALTLIISKIARMCNGDPHYLDNWVDISGYATLVIKELS